MKRFLLLLAGVVLLGMAAADAIWPAPPDVILIDEPDARPGVWPSEEVRP